MGNVGNTTGSMLYGFGAFLVIYLAGALILSGRALDSEMEKEKERRRTGKWLM